VPAHEHRWTRTRCSSPAPWRPQRVPGSPPSGNMAAAAVWLAQPRRSAGGGGTNERLHVLGVDGGRIKSTASRLSLRDGPAASRRWKARTTSPLPPVRQAPPAVEVDRLVNVNGCVSLGGAGVIGSPLARVRIRVDGHLLHVVDEQGQLRAPNGARSVPQIARGCAEHAPQESHPSPTVPRCGWTGSSASRARFRWPDSGTRSGACTPARSSTSAWYHAHHLRRRRRADRHPPQHQGHQRFEPNTRSDQEAVAT
jgi:hypothetical protein